jgi:7-cyano-7-deazaguanine synthase in queuosine biosynthesis
MRPVLLFTGGIDSTIAYYWLKERNPLLLYFPLSHRYEKAELRAIDNFQPRIVHKGPNLHLGYFERPDGWIPGRNLVLAVAAANYGDEIYLISQKGEDTTEDRNPIFYQMTSQFLTTLFKKEKTLQTLFSDMTKQDMVKWYLDNNHPVEVLTSAYSCFKGKQEHCFECPACFRRFVAFSYNNLNIFSEEQIQKLMKWPGTKEYYQKMIDAKYEAKRTIQTLQVLRDHARYM